MLGEGAELAGEPVLELARDEQRDPPRLARAALVPLAESGDVLPTHVHKPDPPQIDEDPVNADHARIDAQLLHVGVDLLVGRVAVDLDHELPVGLPEVERPLHPLAACPSFGRRARRVEWAAMPDWKKLLDTAVGQMGEAAEVAGQGIRRAADEAKKVAGIGVGTIEISPDRSAYRLGEVVRGTVSLKLTEPIPARRLVVALRASLKRLSVKTGSGKATPVQQHETIIDHQVDVGGEQTYETGTHYFAVHVPDRIDPEIKVKGPLGDLLEGVQAVRAMTDSPIKWTVVAFLEIPWKRNLSRTIDLTVRD